MGPNHDNETSDRMLALERAMLIPVDRLAMRGAISVDEGVDILPLLSRSSDISAARVSQSFHLLSQLQRLRRGDGSLAPDAPVTGPVAG